MKFKELLEKTVPELYEEALKLKREKMSNVLLKATEALEKTHLVRQNRREFARIKTAIAEKKAGK